MAKNKKRNEATYEEKEARDQQIEEGGVYPRSKSDNKQEEYEETTSRPGNIRNDRRQIDSQQGSDVEDEAGDVARETGDEPDMKKEKARNVSAQSTRDAKRKGIAPPSSRVKRKEPSRMPTKNTARAGKGNNSKNKTARKSTSGKSRAKTKSH